MVLGRMGTDKKVVVPEARVKALCNLLENLTMRFPQDIPDLAPLLYVARGIERDNPVFRDLSLVRLRNVRSIARQTSVSSLANSAFVISELRKRDIPVLAMKGTVLSQLAYGDPNFRVSNDFDLLVKPTDSKEAVKALQLIGFRFAKEQDRSACQVHMTSPVAGTLDLHTRLAPRWFPLADGFKTRFDDPYIVGIDEHEFPTFTLPEQILLCAINAVKEYPEKVIRKSLVDMAALLHPLAEADYGDLWEVSCQRGLGKILQLCFAMLKNLNHPLPVGADLVLKANLGSRRRDPASSIEMKVERMLEGESERSLTQSEFAHYHTDLRERLPDRVKARASALLLPAIPLAQTRARGLHRPDVILGALIRRGVTLGGLRERYVEQLWRVRPHILYELFEDGGLVFDEWSGQIHSLNSAGAFLFDQIGTEQPWNEALEAYRSARGVARTSALREITDILTWWHRSGWIGEMQAEDEAFGIHPNVSERSPATPSRFAYSATVWHVVVAGVPLRVTADRNVNLGQFDQLIGPFVDMHGGETPAASVMVFNEDDGVVIEVDGEEAGFCIDPAALPDMLLDTILVAAVGHLPYAFYLHAALLEISKGGVLLPAPSGSGKSTLSIALSHRGAEYISDEMSFLSGDFRAYGVHVFPTVKESGWSAMRNLVVDLERLTDFRRRDGITMKYLTEGFVRDPKLVPRDLEVRAVIFPEFHPGGGNRLEEIGPVACFSMLMEQCLSMNEAFDAAAFRRLASFLREVASYRMSYEETEFAVSNIFEVA
ncbi:nucleotidyltransferase family protein [Tropicimonas sediminicola]|uniref:Uncharacterized nucleotidyltransferase n=1 Tax=Tropicimonas sediminicola TaxID=1031541 RepID=A0A239M335_9RHOB|nr:nucleotidyltransferase family protein [Tropicimonas sediminicola]SNT36702.1 Uncharacterised nucleotidyltransferase [Tropicimonas sediminicola]